MRYMRQDTGVYASHDEYVRGPGSPSPWGPHQPPTPLVTGPDGPRSNYQCDRIGQDHQSWLSMRCSRLPVMGLVRLQRALRIEMSCSTQSTPPGEIGRRGHGPMGEVHRHGNRRIPVQREGVKIAARGCTRVYNLGPAGGLSTVRKAVNPTGEIWVGWYQNAQAVWIAE